MHIKYQQNVFTKTDLSGTTEQQNFGKVVLGETDTIRRTLFTQPYLTFRMEIDNRQLAVTAV